MARVIKIKRSNVADKVPAVTDLELGELAMNTTSGKLFMKKNVGGVESVIELGPGQEQLNNRVEKTGDVMTGPLSMGANYVASSYVPTTSYHLTNKQYVDGMDYLNMNPKAGLTSVDSTVPVYSDFKFSLGMGGASVLTIVDRESKQIVYYTAATPTGKYSAFRAYRFSDSDSFVFDNDPISGTFLRPDERVAMLLNVGTNFVVLRTCLIAIPYTSQRIIIAKTGGSSRWQDWTFAYDVSSLYSGISNWSLVQDATYGDRILQILTTGDTNLNNHTADLLVYDSSLTLVRQQRLYTLATDTATTDLTGAGRLGGHLGYGYYAYGFGSAFTWNPSSQTLHQKTAGYYNVVSTTGAVAGQSTAQTLSWNIPRSWLMTGAGTPTNLIPIKSSGFRYHTYVDATWDTEDGGMSEAWFGVAGQAISLTTDEYSGQMYLSTKGTWTTNDIGTHYRLAIGKVYKTLGLSIEPNIKTTFNGYMPDGSAWAKSINPALMQVIGNQISFVGGSIRDGSQVITTTFSTSSFSTAYTANDTFKLDAANATLNAYAAWPMNSVPRGNIPGSYSTVVVAGNPIVFWAMPEYEIQVASANGTVRKFTGSGVTVPAIPSTISGITGLLYRGQITWNGSTTTPIIWAIVGNTTKYYVAKCTGGVWTIVSSTIFDDAVGVGMSARQDSNNLCYIGGCATVLTEGGKWISDFIIPYVGAQRLYNAKYEISTNVMTVSLDQFQSINAGKPGGYDALTFNSGGGTAYGYSTVLGYFAAMATMTSSSTTFMTSKDPRGVGAAFTEDQWFVGADGSGDLRYETFISCEAASGLVAYLSEYPIFLGGYYTKVPTTTLTLLPNAVNYIYATKVSSDRSTVSVTSDTSVLPNSFARMKLAAVTTNATAIVSSEVYSFDGIGLPQQDGNAGKSLKTDGAIAYWGSDAPTNKSVSSSLQLVPTDHGGVINLTSGDVRLPASIQGGFEVTIMAGGTDRTDITITPMSGAGLYWMGDHVGAGGTAGVRTLKAGGWAVLRKIDSLIYGPGVSVWMIYGQGLV